MEKDFSAKIRKLAWIRGRKWPLIYPNTSVCPKCHHKLFPLPDRPDIIIAVEGIEVKESDDRFNFDSISAGQREWATKRTEEGFKYWIALQLGTDRPNSKSNNRKRAWLIPWSKWIEIESLVLNFQKSIPFYILPNTKKELKDGKLDAVTQFSGYELKWHDGEWTIPDNHPYLISIESILDKLIPLSIDRSGDKYVIKSEKITITLDSLEQLKDLDII